MKSNDLSTVDPEMLGRIPIFHSMRIGIMTHFHSTRHPNRTLCSWQICALIGFFCLLSGAPGQMPYVTNLNLAMKAAQEGNRTVVLYTGRAELCISNNPQWHFNAIMKQHPQLAARTNKLVVCEQFIHAKAKDARGEPSPAFFRDIQKYEALFDRYDIRLFHPTLTFLDADAAKLNGPFTEDPSDRHFKSLNRDCYETLDDYLAANPALRMSQAQSNLAAVVLRPRQQEQGFGLFQSRYHPEGGQKALVTESGLPSTKYALGEPLFFVPRECAMETGFDMAGNWPESTVTASGRFERGAPYTGPILIRLNGAYFWASIQEVGTGKGQSKVSFQPGEYFFSLNMRNQTIAEALLGELKKLAPKGNEKTIAK